MDKQRLFNTVLQILNIPSPTRQEKSLSRFIGKHFPSSDYRILRSGDSFIASSLKKSSQPHLSLVGHLDVVPEFFPPHRKQGRIYGAGASDMKASLGVFLYLLKYHREILQSSPYRISFIFYAQEEGTPLVDNGLYHLIDKFPDWFRTVDMALVGEPTDNTVQIGCCGSIHVRIRIPGKACHSARPWQGENALYKALPFLTKISRVKPRPYKIAGVVFRDVWQVTVGRTKGGITTIPEEWVGNVNYRFAPRMEEKEAIAHCTKFLIRKGLTPDQFEIDSFSPGGKIIETSLYQDRLAHLKKQGMRIEPKQAWTDVAQFANLGIPSFNCGPGLAAQCHTPNEYAVEKDIVYYTKTLIGLLQGKNK